MRPHRWQPTRLPHPWDSSGKNTGVGCHFLLQCTKGKSESEVAQSWLLATPWTAAYQAPPSVGLSRQEYWSGLPLLSLGDYDQEENVVKLPSGVRLFETPMDCCTPGLPVPHCLLKFAQVHVHCVGDAIKPSCPLPWPTALSLSHHQGVFQWVSSLHKMAKILGLQLQASVLPMSIQGWFPLRLTGLILLSKGLWRGLSSTTVERHQFFGALPSLGSSSHNCVWSLGRTYPWLFRDRCGQSDVSAF